MKLHHMESQNIWWVSTLSQPLSMQTDDLATGIREIFLDEKFSSFFPVIFLPFHLSGVRGSWLLVQRLYKEGKSICKSFPSLALILRSLNLQRGFNRDSLRYCWKNNLPVLIWEGQGWKGSMVCGRGRSCGDWGTAVMFCWLVQWFKTFELKIKQGNYSLS